MAELFENIADKPVFTSGDYAVYESPGGYLIGRPANGVVEITVHSHVPPRALLPSGRARKMNLAVRIAALMVSAAEGEV